MLNIAVSEVGFSEADLDVPLVRRCKSGDMHAYRQLVERHERRVVSILSRIIPPSRRYQSGVHAVCDIDDLAQEVFVQAWRALPSFRGDARFSTWLYRIATNRAIKEWRRAQKQSFCGWRSAEIDNDQRPGDRRADPEALMQQVARDEQLRAAIDALPQKQRTVILLHYFEEYSCEEIAQILECSVGTVWSRLHYACRKLRSSLGADYGVEARLQPV